MNSLRLTLIAALVLSGLCGCGGSNQAMTPQAPSDPRFQSFLFPSERMEFQPAQESTFDGGLPTHQNNFQPKSGAAHPNSYALVIGIERYRDVSAPPGARRDAEVFSDVAQRTLGLPRKNLRVLLDDRATRSDIEREVQWLRDNASPHGDVFFFFAGHGSSDVSPQKGATERYLIPYDGQATAVAQTGLPLEALLGALMESRAGRVIAFVDACYSGVGGRSVGTGHRGIERERVKPESRVALFAASEGSQISGPNRSRTAGLFTSAVAEGLSSALADIDGDGTITLDELKEWVTPRVEREAHRQNRAQTPVLSLGPGISASDVVIASGLDR